MERAVFAGGCFWGIEDISRSIKGVVSTRVGYAGGAHEHPTYEQVLTGKTGHAESVEVVFDPKTVSYEDLLGIFFASHDPTQKDRQGPDVGSQYRSLIFFSDDRQRILALESIRSLMESGRHNKPIVTEVQELRAFFQAEEYHQQYLDKLRRKEGLK